MKSLKKARICARKRSSQDSKEELQHMISLEGRDYVEADRESSFERVELQGAKVTLVSHWSKVLRPKPHKANSAAWEAIQKIQSRCGPLSLQHFRRIKVLGSGNTGIVHLVELIGTGEYFAMKSMDKAQMIDRNKVHCLRSEREILGMMDHPFLPTLYASFQTTTHACLVTDFCPEDLFRVQNAQRLRCFGEDVARFYAAEVVVALEYLHFMGVVYRDLKLENVLVQKNGHLQLTDFDLSFLSSAKFQLIWPVLPRTCTPVFIAEPVSRSNSLVGTEEYIAPEMIKGSEHGSAVDWWALGILIYEMLFGRTPFKGSNKQQTFENVLKKEVTFSSSKPVSLQAKQLLRALLHRDPTKRLGSLRGASEIKKHAFFKGIKWPLLRWMSPPELDTPVQLTV